MQQLTFFQRLRSLFYPVLVRHAASPVNPVLELYRYRGRWQLATSDALYSDGVHYRPLTAAFRALRDFLPDVKRVLVLGTGLGSAVQILRRQGYAPSFTLVELDQQVLRWALELMPADARKNIRPVCADAAQHVLLDTELYDLVIVDVFEGRHVPAFVLEPAFLGACQQRLATGGRLVLNYMIGRDGREEKAKTVLSAVFSNVSVLSFYLNRVFIATA